MTGMGLFAAINTFQKISPSIGHVPPKTSVAIR